MKAPVISLSILASSIGGSATLGMIGLAWKIGTPAFWWLGSGVIGLLILGLLLARKIRSSRARTMPELCQKQFGKIFRTVCAIIILIAYIPIIAAQFGALAIIITPLTGLDYHVSLLAGAFALFSYTFIRGQNAVMKSDVWQFVILALSLLFIFLFCLQNPDARLAISNAPIEIVNKNFPPSRLAYFLLILGSSFVVGPMLYGRVLSAKNQYEAKKGCLYSAIGLFFMALLVTCIGLGLHGIFPPETMPADFKDQDILDAYLDSLPEWVATPCLLGLFCAIISSADSCLFTAASIGANDLLANPSTHKCRTFMTVITCAAIALSFQGKGILNLLLVANDIYVCGVVPPIFLSLVSSSAYPPQKFLLITAMFLGGAIGAAASLLQLPLLSITGLCVSVALCFFSQHWIQMKKYFFTELKA